MRAKIIILMILVILFTIFVSQNTAVIMVKAYFWKFEMSTIVLISITGFVGIILGFIIAKIFDRPKIKQKNKKEGNIVEKNIDKKV